MSGECDKCGEHTLECECRVKFSSAPVSNAYWGYVDKEHKDDLIRDLPESTAIRLTSEQIKEAEEGSIWFEVTDDGLKMSKRLVEFIIEHGKSVTPPSSTVTMNSERENDR